MPAERADLLDLPLRDALGVLLAVLEAVALDGGDELLRERVHDRRADPVQPAGVDVAAVGVAELAAGVQHREHQFEAALLVLRVHLDGDAAAVVGDGQRVAALVQRDVMWSA